MRKEFLLILVLAYGLSLNGQAQQVIINGKPGERLLEWKDFKGDPNDNVPFLAYTYWNMHYKIGGFKDSGVYVLPQGLEVNLLFESEKSWVKKNKSNEALLKHEQGHFDLGRLCQLEFLGIVKKINFEKASYQVQLKTAFKNTIDKYRGLGNKYDEETNHSVNKEQQEKWNGFFQQEKERLLQLNQ